MGASGVVLAVWLAVVQALGGGTGPAGLQPAQPMFRSGIDLVTISAVVRDQDGRLVTGLDRDDFELIDSGARQRIVEFRADEAPVSVALLVDASGSMEVSTRLARARETAHHVLSWLRPGRDEIAVYAFDTRLVEVHPFSTAPAAARDSLARIQPFGATSLRDAIAAAAGRVVARGRPRRAVVVVTDGLDTASRLTASEAATAASAVDVSVYVVASLLPVDDPDLGAHRPTTAREWSGELADLARATGGAMFVASVPAQASAAARQIVTELRRQYLIAFEPSAVPGWHTLQVRTRDPKLIVRARTGYLAGPRPTGE